jgi:hypothetical protein
MDAHAAELVSGHRGRAGCGLGMGETMNERILELAKEAGFSTAKSHNGSEHVVYRDGDDIDWFVRTVIYLAQAEALEEAVNSPCGNRYPRTTREAFGFIDDGHPWEQDTEPVSWIYKVCFGLILALAIVPCFLFK